MDLAEDCTDHSYYFYSLIGASSTKGKKRISSSLQRTLERLEGEKQSLVKGPVLLYYVVIMSYPINWPSENRVPDFILILSRNDK